MHYGFGGFSMGGFGMILFWIVLIAAVAWLAIALTGFSRKEENRRSKSALEILEERYAAGEISRHEFETKKQDIAGGQKVVR